jgi:hypothetical protein
MSEDIPVVSLKPSNTIFYIKFHSSVTQALNQLGILNLGFNYLMLLLFQNRCNSQFFTIKIYTTLLTTTYLLTHSLTYSLTNLLAYLKLINLITY